MAKAGAKKDRLINIQDLEHLKITWNKASAETPEQAYVRTVPKERRSFLGQFFTPQPIAKLMTNWIASLNPSSVLDPAVGPGIFVRTARKAFPNARITGIDIDKAPLGLVSESMLGDELFEVINDDFLKVDLPEFDAILANPPYLRHQNLNYTSDIHGEIGVRNGIKISRLSNLYILFILEICRKLRNGGRASIIVPAEWMNANYGTAIKKYFFENGFLKRLVYFSHNTLAFEDALTTAAILFIEKTPKQSEDLDVIYIENALNIDDIDLFLQGQIDELAGATWTKVPWSVLLITEKWDRLFSMGTHEHCENLITVEAVAKSRRGIATGANDFFHLRPSQALTFGIQSFNQKACIGRSQDVKGLIFSNEDLAHLEAEDARTRLVSFTSDLAPSEEKYIEKGISENLHERYLLASRSPWYSMENREPAPIWAAVFGRGTLRFVLNTAGISNLTTFHCLYPQGLNNKQTIALVALLNSAPVQERAMRHRRVYGGGLGKFEPKDLLQLEIPDIRLIPESTLDEIIALFTNWDKEIRKTSDFTPSTLNDLVSKLIDAPSPVSDQQFLATAQTELF